jgi:hypothetical protein
MAKLSVSVDVPLPPEKAWECASDLSRYKEWLTIHRVCRSNLPETLEKGDQIDSIVEVEGIPNRPDSARRRKSPLFFGVSRTFVSARQVRR